MEYITIREACKKKGILKKECWDKIGRLVSASYFTVYQKRADKIKQGRIKVRAYPLEFEPIIVNCILEFIKTMKE
jgi:hypothetical protein